MGIKERQQREREAVRHSILSAARELFVSEGYRNVSMRKLAERIEYSPAAIYGYFPNKDSIFFALAEEGFRLLAGRVERAIAGLSDPIERLRQALWAFYEFSKEHPQYFELMFTDRSVPSLNQDFERFEFFHAIMAAAEADIRTCIDRGLFSSGLNPAAALHVLWAGMLGASTINHAGRLAPGENPDALANDTLGALLGGLTTTLHTTFVAAECPYIPATDSPSHDSANGHVEAP
jgi:AcrR family transcriptional regulator